MTEELKKALESAKTEGEMKVIAEKFKDEIQKLSEDELDKVAGGKWSDNWQGALRLLDDVIPKS